MEKEVRVYRSHEEAENADVEHDKTLTPEERVDVVLELRNRYYPDAAQQRLARVYRVTKLERS